MEDTPEQDTRTHLHNQPSSSSGDRKLKIKIKISPMHIIQQNNTHAQAINKQLGSQNQSANFYNRASEESVIVNQGDHRKTRVFKNIRPVCSLCGKKFRLLKSLFGHMRSHPDREWKQIQENNVNSSSSADDVNADAEPVSDVSQPIPAWTVRGRRGQKAVNKFVESSVLSASDDDEDEDEDEEEVDEEELKYRNAVNDLMLLKQLDCSELSGVSLAAAEKIGDGVEQNHEASNSYALTLDNRGEETDPHELLGGLDQLLSKKEMKRSLLDVDGADDPVMKKCRFKEGRGVGSTNGNSGVIKNSSGSIGVDGNASGVLENQGPVDKSHTGDGGKDNIHNYFDGININEEMAMGNKNKKAKKMKQSMMDIDSSLASEKYRCSTCNKCFSSHQALGGHRSSHNKFKMTIINGGAGSTSDHPNQSTLVTTAALTMADQVAEHADHHRFQNHQQQVISADQVNNFSSVNTVGLTQVCAIKHTSTEEGARRSKAVADNSSGNIHQCRECGKIFPSGQALGGHKRCHWTAPADQYPVTQAQTQVLTSSGEQSSQAGGGRLRFMDIDLNMTPPSDEDDAEGGGSGVGDGHAANWLCLSL